MRPVIVYAVMLGVLVALLWPGSKAGGAVLNVTGGTGSVLQSATSSIVGGGNQQ